MDEHEDVHTNKRESGNMKEGASVLVITCEQRARGHNERKIQRDREGKRSPEMSVGYRNV